MKFSLLHGLGLRVKFENECRLEAYSLFHEMFTVIVILFVERCVGTLKYFINSISRSAMCTKTLFCNTNCISLDVVKCFYIESSYLF